MENSNSYFRSYIRRYACTSDEILNALKKSGESEQQILIEITTGQADYVSSEYNQSTDEEMIVLTTCKPNPDGNLRFAILDFGDSIVNIPTVPSLKEHFM
ncbi:hypothetical protein FO519_005081 [Halicephalobus sp. NKZ332]|nr:hypothetical protein FO519_005081 [Halicephalobus sp. NKZ332]